MDTSTGNIIQNTEDIIKTPITITFTIKQAAAALTTIITFISGTAIPFMHNHYNKKLENAKQTINMQYQFQINQMNAKIQEYDITGNQLKSTILQMQTLTDFLLIQSRYSDCYLRYIENDTPQNKKLYEQALNKYANYIQYKETHNSNLQDTSCYFSGMYIYINGQSYVIPRDVLKEVKELNGE